MTPIRPAIRQADIRSVFALFVDEAAAAAVPLAEDCAVDDFITSGVCELLLVPALCVPVATTVPLLEVSVK